MSSCVLYTFFVKFEIYKQYKLICGVEISYKWNQMLMQDLITSDTDKENYTRSNLKKRDICCGI